MTVLCVVETLDGATQVFESEGIGVMTSAETALVTITDEHDRILSVLSVSEVVEIRQTYLGA